MLLRDIIAFLMLLGLAAFLVPFLITGQPHTLPKGFVYGLPFIGGGTQGLLSCVVSFYREGVGTLAPWSPPRLLVTSDLHRYSRNTKHLRVMPGLGGWAISFRSPALPLYCLVVFMGFHLRVILNEEPWLAKTHGLQWQHYAGQVKRWLGRSARQPSRST